MPPGGLEPELKVPLLGRCLDSRLPVLELFLAEACLQQFVRDPEFAEFTDHPGVFGMESTLAAGAGLIQERQLLDLFLERMDRRAIAMERRASCASGDSVLVALLAGVTGESSEDGLYAVVQPREIGGARLPSRANIVQNAAREGHECLLTLFDLKPEHPAEMRLEGELRRVACDARAREYRYDPGRRDRSSCPPRAAGARCRRYWLTRRHDSAPQRTIGQDRREIPKYEAEEGLDVPARDARDHPWKARAAF